VIQDAEGPSRLIGWSLIAAACLDVVLAGFFAFVRPPADARARLVLPLALALGALTLGGLGVAFLVGAIGG